jgi:hypothetical protein
MLVQQEYGAQKKVAAVLLGKLAIPFAIHWQASRRSPSLEVINVPMPVRRENRGQEQDSLPLTSASFHRECYIFQLI